MDVRKYGQFVVISTIRSLSLSLSLSPSPSPSREKGPQRSALNGQNAGERTRKGTAPPLKQSRFRDAVAQPRRKHRHLPRVEGSGAKGHGESEASALFRARLFLPYRPLPTFNDNADIPDRGIPEMLTASW